MLKRIRECGREFHAILKLLISFASPGKDSAMSKKLGSKLSCPKNAGDNASYIETRESQQEQCSVQQTQQKANLQRDIPPPEISSQRSGSGLVRIALVLLQLIAAIVLFVLSTFGLSPLHAISSFIAIVRTLKELLGLLKKEGRKENFK